MKTTPFLRALSCAAAIGVAAGCGGGSKSTATSVAPPAPAPIASTASVATSAPATSTPVSTTAGSSTAGGASTPGASPLVAEAQSAAAGDIPDNQVFIDFANTIAGYTFKYPEGWAQKGAGNDVTIRDKNNIVHIVVSSAAPPTAASMAADLAALAGSTPSLKVTAAPKSVTIGSQQAIKATYETVSDANPVTGKTVTLVVDRYAIAHAGKLAIIDMATPRGVDNVDAYRLMIGSLKWTR